MPGPTLLPHQQALIEEYRSGSAPRVVALDAPVGSGKTLTLATIAAERAAHGDLVLMVLSHNLLVRQMTELLSQLGARPAAIFASPADLRLALDERDSPLPDSGLVVCSTSVVLSPVAAKVLSTASPSLLIVDDVPASLSSALGRPLSALADRAQRVIFTDGAANAWFPASEKRIWTFPLTGNDGRQIAPEFSVRIREYPGNPTDFCIVSGCSRIPSRFLRKKPLRKKI